MAWEGLTKSWTEKGGGLPWNLSSEPSGFRARIWWNSLLQCESVLVRGGGGGGGIGEREGRRSKPEATTVWIQVYYQSDNITTLSSH